MATRLTKATTRRRTASFRPSEATEESGHDGRTCALAAGSLVAPLLGMTVSERRAFILPVVLVLIGLLAMTMAGFIFFVRAETAGMIAQGDAQQARLAAESGLEELIATIRVDRHNVRAWFDVPDRFRHALVWSPAFNREEDPVRDARSRTSLFEDAASISPAWRYSVVGQNLFGLTESVRFGITPEGSKLNINIAAASNEAQVRQLILPLLVELQLEAPEEQIDTLLDWIDEDDDPRPNGAESEYYNTLSPPYSAKNGPLDTIEEMLLIKGWTAAMLYGEDTNRNGYLDPNEDDGDATFPEYDNADSILDRGVATYLTTWTREPDTALDNKPRINLNADAAFIQAQAAQLIEEQLELGVETLSEETIAFILGLKQQNFNFADARTPAVLYQGVDIDAPSEEEEEGGANPGPLDGSPVTLEELPFIMDRLSVLPVAQGGPQMVAGLINVNTAPLPVLLLIPGISQEAAEALVATRATLDAGQLATTAWPMTSQAVDLQTFHAIAPYITTKSYQYHVEVIGYADHVKLYRRYEWIVEMIGPLAQIKYRRDLTPLGFAWPVDDDTLVVSSG